MSRQIDVLVIGSGVAGAMAAARAKERNLEVLCIAKSMGSTAYSSGAIDVPQLTEQEESYAPQAFELFRSLTEKLAWTRVEKVATQIGTLKSCFMVQKSQAFDFSVCSQEALLGVAQFSGLPSFEAAPVAKMLSAQGFRVQPIQVEFRPRQKARWGTFLEFARDFSTSVCLEAMQAVRTGFQHIFFPAALGFEPPLEFLEAVHGSELLGLSHSIPGLRLGNSLFRQATQTGVQSFVCEKNHIIEVKLENGEVLSPKSVVLATGRFLSGGFVDTREAIFSLSLKAHELPVDANLRPLDQFGEVFATNLFAARSSHEGMGRAILNGYQAGSLC